MDKLGGHPSLNHKVTSKIRPPTHAKWAYSQSTQFSYFFADVNANTKAVFRETISVWNLAQARKEGLKGTWAAGARYHAVGESYWLDMPCPFQKNHKFISPQRDAIHSPVTCCNAYHIHLKCRWGLTAVLEENLVFWESDKYSGFSCSAFMERLPLKHILRTLAFRGASCTAKSQSLVCDSLWKRLNT